MKLHTFNFIRRGGVGLGGGDSGGHVHVTSFPTPWIRHWENGFPQNEDCILCMFCSIGMMTCLEYPHSSSFELLNPDFAPFTT